MANEPYDLAVQQMNARLGEARETERQDELAALQEEADDWGWEADEGCLEDRLP